MSTSKVDPALPSGDEFPHAASTPFSQEGLTVIREVADEESASVQRWAGLYGDDAHDLDAPGMLAAVIGPLAVDGIPVFVTSTFHSDLVLVPWSQTYQAITILESSGHQVRRSDGAEL